MRKLKLQVQLSVDGYMATTAGKTDWLVWNWGAEWTWDNVLRNYFIELTASVDSILLSRKMAEEGFIGHWTKVAKNPGDPQYAFARPIADARKVVFTKTLEKSLWENTELAKGDLVTEINRLKNQEGKDMIVYGGATFVSSLIEAGLIDEFHLFINPAALGSGKALFKGLNSKQILALVSAGSYDCGIVALTYKRVQ
jgi:dihydrofolate reductase